LCDAATVVLTQYTVLNCQVFFNNNNVKRPHGPSIPVLMAMLSKVNTDLTLTGRVVKSVGGLLGVEMLVCVNSSELVTVTLVVVI